MTQWVRGAEWWDILPDILRGLRVLPHSVTGLSPHTLVFKQQPHWADRLELAIQEPPTHPPTTEQEEQLFHAQVHFWEAIRLEVTARLHKADTKMIESYRRNRAVANGDCRVIFKEGD